MDPLKSDYPTIIDGTVIRAVDGLQFTARDALLAYQSGLFTCPTNNIHIFFLSRR